MKIYVGNFMYTMTESQLNDLFSLYGTVTKVRIITDHYTRQSKGFGYIEMPDKIEGAQAIAGLNGRTENDRLLIVREARPRDMRFGKGW